MAKRVNYSDITDDIRKLTDICLENSNIDPELYNRYEVKRGLRDLNGKGVLAGLTEISEIRTLKIEDGVEKQCPGKLFYRGINVEDIVKGCVSENRFGFEETVYLLLFGKLPNKEQLADFTKLLGYYRTLPSSFVRDVILKKPSSNMMNGLSRSVLTLYSYDTNPEDTSLENVMRQCIQLISIFPMLTVYSYHAHRYYYQDEALIIHRPRTDLSAAENILHLLLEAYKAGLIK